jgi:hypothetical protein
MNAQRSTLKAIGKVNLEIMRTAAHSKLHLISELDLDVHLRLKILQDHESATSPAAFLTVRQGTAEAEEPGYQHLVGQIFLRLVTVQGREHGRNDGHLPIVSLFQSYTSARRL